MRNISKWEFSRRGALNTHFAKTKKDNQKIIYSPLSTFPSPGAELHDGWIELLDFLRNNFLCNCSQIYCLAQGLFISDCHGKHSSPKTEGSSKTRMLFSGVLCKRNVRILSKEFKTGTSIGRSSQTLSPQLPFLFFNFCFPILLINEGARHHPQRPKNSPKICQIDSNIIFLDDNSSPGKQCNFFGYQRFLLVLYERGGFVGLVAFL